MKEYLIAYICHNDRITSSVYCGKNMNEAVSQFRRCFNWEIIAITELDDSINSNCL